MIDLIAVIEKAIGAAGKKKRSLKRSGKIDVSRGSDYVTPDSRPLGHL